MYIYFNELLYFLAEVNGENIPCPEIPNNLEETVRTQLYEDLGHLGFKECMCLL